MCLWKLSEHDTRTILGRSLAHLFGCGFSSHTHSQEALSRKFQLNLIPPFFLKDDLCTRTYGVYLGS